MAKKPLFKKGKKPLFGKKASSSSMAPPPSASLATLMMPTKAPPFKKVARKGMKKGY